MLGGPGSPALHHPHGTAPLAEITPFDQEDELDGCESEADLDTGAEEWWVPGEAGGGMWEGRREVQDELPDYGTLSPQGRSTGAQLAGARLREDGAAAGGAEKARGEHCLAWGDQVAGVMEEWGPHPATHPGWGFGEENLKEIQQSKRETLGAILVLPDLAARWGTLHLGPAGAANTRVWV